MATSTLTTADQFRSIASSPSKLRLFMLSSLPMAYLAGLRVKSLAEERAVVTISYKYLNKNPFKSIYFASLSMAAELSTGLLCMAQTYKADPAVSMLVVHMEADFMKKAVGRITFSCEDGLAIKAAADQTKATGAGVTVVATSTGIDETGDKVAEFRFTWSMKAKLKK
ncbi:PaaI family thioesterase [Pontibacter ramchanderi]|uniref:Uncharacterized protein DUF4442 n=1 Tax=Pontibacter ramchanderi TaxID=1179743 RepID=A0A2N3UBY2_9BACT|nr:DUF4442 domain-containing protein [Pontibacter ramchanderi]PKV66866.1 uncharacterized protein DUF4442 [Pontibacter ramchanderi]